MESNFLFSCILDIELGIGTMPSTCQNEYWRLIVDVTIHFDLLNVIVKFGISGS